MLHRKGSWNRALGRRPVSSHPRGAPTAHRPSPPPRRPRRRLNRAGCARAAWTPRPAVPSPPTPRDV